MLPVIPLGLMFVPKVCEVKHKCVTDHELKYCEHNFEKRIVVAKMVCSLCKNEIREKGGQIRMTKVTFTHDEWLALINSFIWEIVYYGTPKRNFSENEDE